jgi:hypothetical protein
MDNSTCLGWTLLLAGIILLAAFQNLGLLAILLPLAILVGCGFAHLGDNRSRLTPDGKKG